MDIERRHHVLTPVIANGGNQSDAVDMRPFAGGVLSMPADWTAASLAFYHCATLTGTYQPLYDDTDALVEMTVQADRDYVLPDAVFGCAFVKLWSENAAANANQGAERTFSLSLKG